MADEQLMLTFERLVTTHRRLSEELAKVLWQVTLARIRDVLPTAEVIEVYGDFNEDGVPRLRIRRVLDRVGTVLFDVGEGHDDRRVEDTVDEVDIEYLDRLVELATAEHMGRCELRG